jgi:hypothetical protein
VPRRLDPLAHPLATSVALSLLVFGVTLANGAFVFDDGWLIFSNPRLEDHSLAGLWALWRGTPMPVIDTWCWVLTALFGVGRHWPYHLANVVLHGVDGFLVYRLILAVREWLQPGLPSETAHAGAALGAALFLVHPTKTEAVAWISGCKDVVSSGLALAALLAWLRARRRRDPASGVGAAALFFLAALAKGNTVAVLGAAAVLEWLSPRRSARALALTLAVSAPIALLAIAGWKQEQPDATLAYHAAPVERALLAAHALGRYAEDLVWPLRSAFIHDLSTRRALDAIRGDPSAWAATALGAALLAAALVVVLRRARGAAAVGTALFVTLALPYLGLVPFVFQNISTVADRYLYLPSVGASIAAADLLDRARAGATRRAGVAAIAVVLVGLGVLSLREARLWRHSTAVLRRAIDRGNDSFPLWVSYGMALESEQRDREALAAYDTALDRPPPVDEPIEHGVWASRKLGDPGAAVAFLEHALASRRKLPPREVETLIMLHVIRDDLGRAAELLRRSGLADTEVAERLARLRSESATWRAWFFLPPD